MAREYEKDDAFGHFVRMISALPFAPPDQMDEVFNLLRQKASELKDEKLREFSISLVEYADNQWRNGTFSKQDWNLFDINVMMVPATNNGNEGTNGRMNIDFGVHPNFWRFLRCAAAVFLRADTDIRQLLFAAITPSSSPQYNNLKFKREQIKANYGAGLISLEEYLAAVGAISLHAGRRKVEDEGECPADTAEEQVVILSTYSLFAPIGCDMPLFEFSLSPTPQCHNICFYSQVK